MVTRGTPKNIERYIKVCDDDKIYRLSVKGFFPQFIDESFAYFEYTKDIADAIQEIVNEINGVTV
jgi:hypothetical protein